MDTNKTTTSGQERPPGLGLGSDEAIGKIAEAILKCRNGDNYQHRVHGIDLWEDDLFGLRVGKVETWAPLLHLAQLLDFEPHYLEVIEALRELGWVCMTFPQDSGPDRKAIPEDLDDPAVLKKRPEDFFQEYVAGVRRREMEQRRKLAARRRRGY